MDDHRFTLKEWGVRVAVALVFVALGLLLYIVFSPLRPWLDKSADYLGRIAVTASLLVVVWVAGKNEQLKPYRTLLLVLLIMSVAISLDWVFAIYLLELFLLINGRNLPKWFFLYTQGLIPQSFLELVVKTET